MTIGNLKTEVPPRENELAEIRSPQSVGVQLLDASKPTAFYVEQIRDLRHRFGHQQFLAVTAQMDQEETANEQRQEIVRQKRIEHNLAIHVLQHTPLERYAYAFNSREGNPTGITEFFGKENIDTLTLLYNELENKPRHYASIFKHELADALQRLKVEIATRPQPQPVNLLSRIKGKLGV
jgi:hypothetical protein